MRNGTGYWQTRREEQKAQKAQEAQHKQEEMLRKQQEAPHKKERQNLQEMETDNRWEIEGDEDDASWGLHRIHQKITSDLHVEQAVRRAAIINKQFTALPTQQKTAASAIVSEEAAEREKLLSKIEQQKFTQKFAAQIFQNAIEKANALKEATAEKAALASREAHAQRLLFQRAKTAEELINSRKLAAERAKAFEQRHLAARRKPEAPTSTPEQQAPTVAATKTRTASPGADFVKVDSPIKNGGLFSAKAKHVDPQPQAETSMFWKMLGYK